MKILLDNIIYSTTTQGGISNYWFELSKYLLEQTQDLVLFYDETNSNSNFHRKQLSIPGDQLIISNSVNSSIIRRLSSVKLKVDSKENLIYHSSYYRPLSGIKNYNEITTVHDFTHDYFFSKIKRIAHNNLKYSCIKRSKGIICISDNTYKDLRKFCPPNKRQEVRIIHNGVSKDYYPIGNKNDSNVLNYMQNLGIDSPFVLFIGSRTGYKNFSFVAELIKEMPDLKLVIVGSELNANELKLFNNQTLKRTVILRNVQNADLNLLYNFAKCLIYPSSYEGFGIPIIEAMRSGCPVIALRNSSITEVSGNAAILLNELNASLFKKQIDNLNSNDFKEDLIGKGFSQSTKFSWEKCTKETYDFYDEIAQISDR